jgi:hypothetical protein
LVKAILADTATTVPDQDIQIQVVKDQEQHMPEDLVVAQDHEE